MINKNYIYYGYGLNISSEIELPLSKANSTDEPDVRITWGQIPKDIECDKKISSYSIGNDSFVMHLKDTNMFVGSGKEIIVEAVKDKEADPNIVVPFILSSCIGALLHQRRTLTFHASSVMTKKGATIFLGGTTDGKSTLATILKNKGYQVLSDDICPVEIIDGKPIMYPSGEQIQVWRDVINMLKLPAESLKKIRPQIEKYYLKTTLNYLNNKSTNKQINESTTSTTNQRINESTNQHPPISKIYLLNLANEPIYEIDNKFSNSQKLSILKSNIYRKNFVKEMCIENQYFKKLKFLAENIPIQKFTSPNNELNAEKLLEVLEEDFL